MKIRTIIASGSAKCAVCGQIIPQGQGCIELQLYGHNRKKIEQNCLLQLIEDCKRLTVNATTYTLVG